MLAVLDTTLTDVLDEHFDGDLTLSERIRPGRWRRRRRTGVPRLFDSVLSSVGPSGSMP